MSSPSHWSQPVDDYETLFLFCHACFTAIGAAILVSLTDGDHVKFALGSFCGVQMLTAGVLVVLKTATR